MTAPPTPNGRERARPRGAADSVLPSRSFWSSTGSRGEAAPARAAGGQFSGPCPSPGSTSDTWGRCLPGSQPSHLDRGGKGPSSRLRLPEPPGPGVQRRSWGGPSGTAESSPGDSAVGARGICAPARAGFDSPEIHRPPQAGTLFGDDGGGTGVSWRRAPALPGAGTGRAPTLTGPAPGGLHGHAVGGAAWLRVAVCPGLCPLRLDHPSRSEPHPRPARRSSEAGLRLLTPLQASPKA